MRSTCQSNRLLFVDKCRQNDKNHHLFWLFFHFDRMSFFVAIKNESYDRNTLLILKNRKKHANIGADWSWLFFSNNFDDLSLVTKTHSVAKAIEYNKTHFRARIILIKIMCLCYLFKKGQESHNFPKSQMLFSQACAAWLMVFFWIQEGASVGSGILQLLVTDRDTPQNGPPFSFHIVSGNEDKSFLIDQGGLLSVYSPLRRGGKPQHLLKIQVKYFNH